MSKKVPIYSHLFMAFIGIAGAGTPKSVPVSDSKKLIDLSDKELQQLRPELKRVKELTGEFEPVLEAGEFIELQKQSDLMQVDPQSHLVLDSVSRCQLRVNFEAFKALAQSQKRDTSDGLVLSPFYKDGSTLKRLLKISGPAVSSWAYASSDVTVEDLPTAPVPSVLFLSYPVDDSRGLIKEIVCSYRSGEAEIGSYETLKKYESHFKDKILMSDLISTFRSLDRLNFLTPKASRASDPVVGDGEKIEDKVDRYKNHI